MVFARSSTAFTRAVARQGQRNFSATSLKSNAAQTTEKAAAAAKEGANAAKEGAAAAAKGSTGAAKEGAQVAQDKAATAAKEGVNAAKEGAKVAQDKASSAFDDISKKAQQLGGPVVKRVEGLLGGYSEPIKYNLSVAGSIAKQVYIAESLAPPTSLHSITSAYRQIYSKIADKSYWAHLLTKGDWKKVGIYAVEAYGIFTIGEMIGRRSLVGYKLDTSKHGNHGHH